LRYSVRKMASPATAIERAARDNSGSRRAFLGVAFGPPELDQLLAAGAALDPDAAVAQAAR
jgi:hypothetical protein